MSDIRLSTKIKVALDRGEVSRWQIIEWQKQAEQMEAEHDELWTKTQSGAPDTSYFDGTVDSLKKKQRMVYEAFDYADEPMDALALEATYRHLMAAGRVSSQAPSGLRARTKELVRLGVCEVVDHEGMSPTGRRAQRVGITGRFT